MSALSMADCSISVNVTKSSRLNRPSWCQPASGFVIQPRALTLVTPESASEFERLNN